MNKLIALLAAMLLALTACGSDGGGIGGGDSSDEKKAKANIAKNFLDEESTPFDEESAECFADNIVDEVGLDKLKEYKLLNEDLEAEEDVEDLKMSESDAGKSADAFTDCVDVDKFFEQVFASGDQEIPAEVADCLKDAITEDKFNEVMKATFMGDDEAGQKAMEPALKCMMQGLPSGETSP